MSPTKPSATVRPFEADEQQRKAIEHVFGPMLVVAGAGTGKTTVLTRRIATLIGEHGVPSREILALTYTENAADEMAGRVREQLGGNVGGLRACTFHAYCNNLLIDCGKSFEVLDDQDLWIYLRRRIRELDLKHFVVAADVGRFLRDLLEFMRRCHDELVGPQRYADYVARLERGELPIQRVEKSKKAAELSDDEALSRCQEIARVFARVEAMLKADGLGTFGHMIANAYGELRSNPELLAREQERARFILADEFQDANFAQIKILQLLAGSDRNVFAVGDPDQAVYHFRGASSAAFKLFREVFADAKLVALESNRRSTTPILAAAYAVIEKNPDALADAEGSARYRRTPLISARAEQAARDGKPPLGGPVEIVPLAARDMEAVEVVSEILEKRRRTKCKWADFAVLYRLHAYRDDLAEELARRQIPFAIERMDVLDTPEVRDLLACVGAVVSTADDASLFRVAALPQFGIDGEKLRAGIRGLPREQKVGGLATVLETIQGGRKILDLLREVREEIAVAGAKGKAAVEIVLRRFELDRKSPPVVTALEFVGKWGKKKPPMVTSGEIGELMEYLQLFREADGAMVMAPPDGDAVRLMTVHGAKGLEFKNVVVMRGASPSFPLGYRETLVEFPRELRDAESRTIEDDKTLHSEEERRLFYVAMTRAEDSLTIYAKQGTGKDTTPAGYPRQMLNDPTLRRYLIQRVPRGFQTDLFGQAGEPARTRTAEWIALPPGRNLNARLSASSLQLYETCPLQFKLEREWRIPREAPAAMQYGAVMHAVLRTYYDGVRFDKPFSEEELIDQFRTLLAEAKIQDRYQHDLYETQGIEQLREFLAACARGECPEVLHTEESFEIKIGETTVAGRIDRIDRIYDGDVAGVDVVITDYKTGKPQSQEDADKSLQLSIYALAAQMKWGYQVKRLALYNLAENSRVSTSRDQFELDEAKSKVETVAAKIAEGRFEAKSGFHCRFCAYQTLCPKTEKHFCENGDAGSAAAIKGKAC
ncbi:MAG TPA: ATP-dependent DNA helicase [Terriglobales bacterium]